MENRAARKERANYLTPEELVDKYKGIEDTLFWDVRTIGYFYRKGLLLGKSNTVEKKPLIKESSFLMLMKFHDHLRELSKANYDYSEIEDLYYSSKN